MIGRWLDRTFAVLGECLVARSPELPRATRDYRSREAQDLAAYVDRLEARAAARRAKILDAEAARPEAGDGKHHRP